LNTLTGANVVLLSYANGKIEELDAKRQSLTKVIPDMSSEAVSPEHMKCISGSNDVINEGQKSVLSKTQYGFPNYGVKAI